MNVTKLSDVTPFMNFLKEDVNGRKIDIFKIKNVIPCDNTFYPNCLFKLQDSDMVIKPIDERVMSLNFDSEIEIKYSSFIEKRENDPIFYFIYNTDNYYHFVYDSLPYLISYLELKKKIPNIKLLMNYPNFSKKEFYRFVSEFLEILNIKDDIIMIDENTVYSEVYISDSFTHGFNSNLPPREEIYDFYKNMVSIVKSNKIINNLPKKFYVSRRTWKHGDNSNIGTNYTNRRKLECENELVDYLISEGYEEIFTETLSTIDKIILFDQAESVVGPIGGGLCNVLFSKKECNLISICSPIFLDINQRFKFCFDKVNTIYFEDSFHVENDKWKKWMRVKNFDIIGEIEEVTKDELVLVYTNTILAGWNSDINYNRKTVKKEDCLIIDSGLNSEWNINLNKIKDIIKYQLNKK
jgi:hypothetical protein